MALVLDNTVSGTASNSYCSRASALVYLAEDIHIYSTFASLSTSDAEACLIFATSLLDSEIDWMGLKASSTQKLRWPRTDVYDPDEYAVDSTIHPDFLQKATSFYAYYLSQEDRLAESDTYGFKELDAGSLKMVIDKYDRKITMPNPIWNMLKWYGNRLSGRTRVLVRR